MSTNKAAVVTTEVTPVAPVSESKPEFLHIFASIHHALAEAAVHIRGGMIFNPAMLVEVFPATGQISLHLVRGNPEQHYVDVAKATSAEAIELQNAQHERAIEEAAARLLAERERAAKKATIDAQIAESEKALRALKRTAAAT